uniref:Uncharacterized protein n=1 Tax=Musa acuminata AAA Group TaxID=214697 RepID=A0A2L0RIV5_MUSAC|nr:hypothetical protein [Musa acuminata AAA Group]
MNPSCCFCFFTCCIYFLSCIYLCVGLLFNYESVATIKLEILAIFWSQISSFFLCSN